MVEVTEEEKRAFVFLNKGFEGKEKKRTWIPFFVAAIFVGVFLLGAWGIVNAQDSTEEIDRSLNDFLLEHYDMECECEEGVLDLIDTSTGTEKRATPVCLVEGQPDYGFPLCVFVGVIDK